MLNPADLQTIEQAKATYHDQLAGCPECDGVAVPLTTSPCCVCGQGPVVGILSDHASKEELENHSLTDVGDGFWLSSTDMCGVCTFGEADRADPENW